MRCFNEVLIKVNCFFCFLFKALEIERLETFHNPLGRANLQIDQNSQSTYRNWRLYDMSGISNKEWRQYGRLAWSISPDLAVSFYYT